MSFVSSEEKTLAFVAAQLGASPKGPPRSREKRRPLVTVSRETGAGGNTFGEALCGWLEENQPKGRGPWVLVDRELVDKILEDDALPDRLASWSPEDHLAGVSFVIEELLGLHRATWKPMQETTETILRLGEMGNVVLVGRGANVILGHLPQAFHVRLVASLESRVENVAAARELSKKAARAWVEAEDKARRRFIRRYFQVDVADPLLYNLVVNVDRVPIEEAARVVGEAVLARAERGG
ncbi:MAG: cytidylate kinase-like family protein [Thermoanaerobaculia bacterium]|jgi:cytidylate kinase|nr:cytidylate kinase-like family protein [Thermoanaerobaculia bacterium]